MKSNLRKLLAITASVVLLVSLLAIGTFSAAAGPYAKSISFSKATVSTSGVVLTKEINSGYLPDGFVAFAKNGVTAAGTAVLNVGEVFTSFSIDVIDSFDDVQDAKVQPTFKVSANGSTWDTVVLSRSSSDYYHTGWKAKHATYTGSVSAAKGYKYVQVTANADEYGIPLPGFANFNYNTAADGNSFADMPADAEETLIDFNTGNPIENYKNQVSVENMAMEQIASQNQSYIGAVSKLNVWSPNGATMGAAYFPVYVEGKELVGFKFTIITGNTSQMTIKAYGDIATEIPLVSEIVTPSGAGYAHVEYTPAGAMEDFEEITVEISYSNDNLTGLKNFSYYSVAKKTTASSSTTKPTTKPTTQSTTKPTTQSTTSKPTTQTTTKPVTQPTQGNSGNGGLTYEDGLQDGYDSGFNDGYDGGFNDGYDGGYNDGYDGGYDDGFDDGGDDGSNEGTNDDYFGDDFYDDGNNDDYFGDDYYDDGNTDEGDQNDTQTDADTGANEDGGSLWLILAIVGGVAILGCGAATYFVIRKKKAAAPVDPE